MLEMDSSDLAENRITVSWSKASTDDVSRLRNVQMTVPQTPSQVHSHPVRDKVVVVVCYKHLDCWYVLKVLAGHRAENFADFSNRLLNNKEEGQAAKVASSLADKAVNETRELRVTWYLAHQNQALNVLRALRATSTVTNLWSTFIHDHSRISPLFGGIFEGKILCYQF